MDDVHHWRHISSVPFFKARKTSKWFKCWKTLLFMACVDLGPSNLKVVFNRGWFCPQRTFPRCLEKRRSPQLWGRYWHLVVIGQRDCEHPAVREAAPKEPSNINSTQSGRPRFTPTCWVAGFSLRDSLIHCPLKHPLFTPNGRSSLIYMCEVTSFQI